MNSHRIRMKPRQLTEPERDALTRLVLTHQARIRAFLCRFEPDSDLLDELTQDVFISVIARVDELSARDEENAGKYLRGVARNLVRQRWRKRRQGKEKLTVNGLVADQMEARLESETDELSQRVRWLKDCRQSLTDRAHTLVDLHFRRRVPMVEIAKQMKRSAASIRMTMLRIRRELRQCIERRQAETVSF